MKTRNSTTVLVLLAVFALLLSGCGQVTPPGKGGDGGDNKQQENIIKSVYSHDLECTPSQMRPENKKQQKSVAKRIYSYDYDSENISIFSTNLDFKGLREEYKIPNPKPQSDYVLKSGLDFRIGQHSVISISNNKKFIFILTVTFKEYSADELKNADTYLVDGKKVQRIDVTEYSIYDTSTKKFHYIGASCQYRFGLSHPQEIKEIGHKYYLAAWATDELLLVETTKNKKIYTVGQDTPIKVSENTIEVPYATAKATSFSLKNFKLSLTSKFKPIKPWASYSDSCTGIVGYFDPFYPFTKALYLYYPETYGEMRYPGFNTVITTLSDLKGTKNYDLYNLAEKALPKDYALGRSFFLGSMIDKNNKKMCYYIMEGYQKNVKNDEKAKHEYIVFGLDFNTGNIKKYMDMNRINSEVKKFVKFPDKITDITISHAYTLDGLTFTKETGPTFFFRCLVRYKDTVNPSTKYMEFLIYGPNLDKLKKMETSFPFRFEYYCIR
ncbi:MAG: hypothetical protein KBC24_02900 [Caldisericia bacterium]|nr:hypothetical protein [Caldisericia bacterium]